MPTTLRIATFNVENLFSRARVLNMQDHDKAAALLGDIGSLKKLIGKSSYSAADKKQILTLAEDLKFYIEIREDREKLFSGKGATRKVSASGSGEWDGAIEFKRTDTSELARKSTADVIKALKADVLCVVEAENRPLLDMFNKQAFSTSSRFKSVMLIDGNDDRGIDVGLLTKHDLGKIFTHIYDRDSIGEVFSRDCLEVEVKLPDGRPIYMLCNHLKSKGYGSQAANDAKRQRQTEQIKRILAKYDLTTEMVIVAGDMNDEPGSPPLQPLLSMQNLHDVLELQFGSDMTKRWTYKYRSQRSQIDFLFVSQPLKDAFKSADVERRGIHGITGQQPFPSVTSQKDQASDHGGVWAEFDLP